MVVHGDNVDSIKDVLGGIAVYWSFIFGKNIQYLDMDDFYREYFPGFGVPNHVLLNETASSMSSLVIPNPLAKGHGKQWKIAIEHIVHTKYISKVPIITTLDKYMQNSKLFSELGGDALWVEV